MPPGRKYDTGPVQLHIRQTATTQAHSTLVIHFHFHIVPHSIISNSDSYLMSQRREEAAERPEPWRQRALQDSGGQRELKGQEAADLRIREAFRNGQRGNVGQPPGHADLQHAPGAGAGKLLSESLQRMRWLMYTSLFVLPSRILRARRCLFHIATTLIYRMRRQLQHNNTSKHSVCYGRRCSRRGRGLQQPCPSTFESSSFHRPIICNPAAVGLVPVLMYCLPCTCDVRSGPLPGASQ